MLVAINCICNDYKTKHEKEMRLQRKHYQMILLWALYVARVGVHGNFCQLCKQKPTAKLFYLRSLLAMGQSARFFKYKIIDGNFRSLLELSVLRSWLLQNYCPVKWKQRWHQLKLLSATEYCYFQRVRLRKCSFYLLCAQLHVWYICVIRSIVFTSSVVWQLKSNCS